jgi:SAM-dependent methyltransferase
LAAIALDPRNAAAYTIDDQRRMALAKNYFAWQGRFVRREIGERVLEIGCGVGNFTGMLLDREAVVAIDKETACIERLQQRYRDQPNLQAFACDASGDKFLRFAGFAPDSCVCLNVLEHIEDDRGLLQRVKTILAPEGVVVVIVPAFPSLYGPIDRNLGHFRRYTLRSLRELAAAAGLRVKKARYMNAFGFFGWWANAHIFRREAQSEAQIAFFDRFIVPLASRAEEIAPPPFGQSFFAVLQKP